MKSKATPYSCRTPSKAVVNATMSSKVVQIPLPSAKPIASFSIAFRRFSRGMSRGASSSAILSRLRIRSISADSRPIKIEIKAGAVACAMTCERHAWR